MLYKEQVWKELLGCKRILIAGYGREGRSSEAFLSSLLPETQFSIADGTDNILQQAPDYDLILKSPGIPTMVFEDVCDLSKISSQTDLFLRVYGSQTIGVTGTKGKSTTTELIYEILRHNVPSGYINVLKAGNMGIPLFDIVPQLTPQTLVVSELSCHQLENIHVAPHIGVLLNLFQEHLDHYHDYEGYKAAKLNIFRYQQNDDYGFYCADNPTLSEAVERLRPVLSSTLMPYSVQQPFECHTSPSLQGVHNQSNVTVAAAVARLLGISDDAIAEVIGSFKGLPYRMEYVGRYHGIDFYDDSISTIPEAAVAAVNALHRVDTLILGGFDRGIDYSLLAQFLPSSSIRNLVFVGEAGRRIYQLYRQQISESDDDRSILLESDYEKIVPWCFHHTAQGRICLLSPAAASYDAFKNFEQRGRVFNELVMNYK